MSTIKVKLKDGTITEYIKPDHCPISDDDWISPLGYCWYFATCQDDGEQSCTNSNGCVGYTL